MANMADALQRRVHQYTSTRMSYESDERHWESSDVYGSYVAPPVSDPDALDPFRETSVSVRRTRIRMMEDDRDARTSMVALMDDDWMGLHLLSYLAMGQELGTSALEQLTGATIDGVGAGLARLVKAEMAEVRERVFRITKKGGEILANLEATTGIDFALEEVLGQ